ncbi:hypothetical protein FGO68_gene15355 [Halteria grandinella]|uniref:Uncharacterized protein n=1 Tax=Halteria grandinella TaxID=5974 RepID=A0A8J8NJN2_HALGN|nr:hypothetical protein FGO68_gene15355 [Halteria grandinella]
MKFNISCLAIAATALLASASSEIELEASPQVEATFWEVVSDIYNVVTNLGRPLIGQPTYFIKGFTQQFAVLDLDDPLFCLTDGISLAYATFELALEIPDIGMTDDLYYAIQNNIYTLDAKCSPLTSGFLSLLAIDQSRNLKNWIASSSGFWSIVKKVGVYGFLGLRLKADYMRFYNQYFFNVINHFDFNSLGQMFAIVTNGFIKGLALYFVAIA